MGFVASYHACQSKELPRNDWPVAFRKNGLQYSQDPKVQEHFRSKDRSRVS